MDRMTPEDTLERPSLRGLHVALAGRLASLSRPQAQKLIADRGGSYCASVTRRTSVVVVGLGGWPLRRDGRISRKLQRATLLQERGHAIELLREDDWLERLGLHDLQQSICRRYTLDQIIALLRIPAGRVRTWISVGLIQPIEDRHGVPCFDFPQVAALRRLDALTQSGVTVARLRRSLGQLSVWVPEARESITRLDLLDRRRLVLRDADGALSDPSGQRLFDFAVASETAAVRFEEPPPTADDQFARAVALEEEERLEEAEVAYRDWLARFGPEPEASYNLANVLYRQGKTAAAIERYRQTVEIDPAYADAWTNLGSVLAELGRWDESLDATRAALHVDPANGNALYNLADTLDEMGRSAEALEYWERFLEQERESPWSDYARDRLRAST